MRLFSYYQHSYYRKFQKPKIIQNEKQPLDFAAGFTKNDAE